MRDLSDFQKSVVNELVTYKKEEKINLIEILQKFLPPDLYIGKSPEDNINIWYLGEKIGFVRGDVVDKITEFVELISNLTDNKYLFKYEIPKDGIKRELSIGKKIEEFAYGWISVTYYLSKLNLESMFLEYYYYTADKLYYLKEHKYKDADEYRADCNLDYIRKYVRWAATAAIASMITAIISLISMFIQRGC
jgi:hypothetical protein